MVTGVPFKMDNEVDFLGEFIDSYDINTFIMDSKRNLPIRYAQRVKDAGARFILIDNQNDICGHADLLILPGFKEQFSSYQDKIEKTRVLIGPEYVILNKHFPVHTGHHRKGKLKVIVSMGGSDKFMLGKKIVSFLEKSALNFECKVIVGRFNDRIPRVTDKRFTFINHTSNLPSLMASSDIGIISMGITAYEAAACGLPSLIVSHSLENLRAARVLEKNAVCKSVGHRNSLEEKNFINSFSTLVKNEALRRRLSETGHLLIDGLGASRVVDHILSYYT